jgi:hypothetical protein
MSLLLVVNASFIVSCAPSFVNLETRFLLMGEGYNTPRYGFTNHLHSGLNRELNPSISSILSKPKSNFESIQTKFLK